MNVNLCAIEINNEVLAAASSLEFATEIQDTQGLAMSCDVSKDGKLDSTEESDDKAFMPEIPEEYNLKDIVTNGNKHERKQIIDLLNEFSNIWKNNNSLPCTSLVEHSIPTGESRPIYQKQYRLPQVLTKVVKSTVQTLLEKGIIQESSSPWASPVVVVPKKSADGSKKYRMCLDLRALNAVTLPDVYPIPNIIETLGHLGGCKYFTTLDLDSGYYQVLIDKKDKSKTAFNTPDGHFEFNRMPFGLINAPATFQRLMDSVLRGLKPERVLVYLDDLIIFNRTFEGHLESLRQVFSRLRDASLKLN